MRRSATSRHTSPTDPMPTTRCRWPSGSTNCAARRDCIEPYCFHEPRRPATPRFGASPFRLALRISDDAPPVRRQFAHSSARRMKQLPLPIVAPATARFDTFVAGANAAALQHLQQMPAVCPPVFLWGPAGSGKTHLLHALAHQRQERGERVGWFDAAVRPPWSLEAGCTLLL